MNIDAENDIKSADAWPPPYTICKSARAKRVSLKICPKKGLQIILPKAKNERLGLQFLEQHRDWVKKNHHLLNRPKPVITLPEHIHLLALEQRWQVIYLPLTTRKRISLVHTPKRLVLMGKTQEFSACQHTLLKWLKQYAYISLRDWLDELCHKFQFSYHKLTIRSQQTRWGSCSADRSISLNYKLLFLPKHWVEYILIHELCHTLYLNHSQRFWQLVCQFVPEQEQIRHDLRKAEQLLPTWLM